MCKPFLSNSWILTDWSNQTKKSPCAGSFLFPQGFVHGEVHLLLLYEVSLSACSSPATNINCPLCIYTLHFCQISPDVSYISENRRWAGSKNPREVISCQSSPEFCGETHAKQNPVCKSSHFDKFNID